MAWYELTSESRLKPIDIEFMRRLHTKVNLIPVIAKADTLTDEEVTLFKQRVSLLAGHLGGRANLSIGSRRCRPPWYSYFPTPSIRDGRRGDCPGKRGDYRECIQSDRVCTQSSTDIWAQSKVPFAVVGSDSLVHAPDGRTVRGRAYPWGVIEVDNEQHCDFVKLRQMLVRTHMEELREHTNDMLYENYRTDKLKAMGVAQDESVFKETKWVSCIDLCGRMILTRP